ncbi:hypothetical protein F383_24132 [Gossypium arboreum]|uniref:Uncharacterized protein n=1 Tax=Gossypium arboreum TaxID=29729 RepID=A0A0B0P0P3_GOSAR|nr:hypothetical protein F383_24132 [Gossypium arboreum]
MQWIEPKQQDAVGWNEGTQRKETPKKSRFCLTRQNWLF